jgi:predicted RND superfamily exporter protein
MSAKPTFFARRALIILVVVFFLVPFALRGARMAIQGMKNDVKDWLPKDFPETAELEWFRDHFVSEQFVIASWEGCYGGKDDNKYNLFLAKLEPETPPSQRAKPAKSADDRSLTAAQAPTDAESESEEGSGDDGRIENPTRYFNRDGFIGDELGFYLTSNQYADWGGKREKWFRGKATSRYGDRNEAWYYITPEGDVYRWKAVDSPIASLVRMISRSIYGPSLEGELVASFGPQDGPWYHERPQRLRAQLFKSITTGPDVLESLVKEGGELSRLEDPEAEAYARLEGTLFGPAREQESEATGQVSEEGSEKTAPRQTCILLTLTDAAKQNLHLVVGRGVLGKPRGLLFEIAHDCKITPADGSGEGLWIGGPPVDNVAIDEEGTVTLVRLVGLCSVVGIGLSLVCFRSITATIMVFFIGGISAVMSVAFVWWLGGSMDAILMSMPALVYVLGMMGATHIINYYHEAVTEHGYPGASERAISHAWKPAILCNITTAIGLLSLLTSELVPIKKFGWFSAIGVLGTLLVLFTYLPAALTIWPQKRRERVQEDSSWLDKLLGGMWHSLGSTIIRNHAVTTIASFLIIGFFCYGVYYMRTSVNMLKMFHSRAKIIRDYTTLEDHLGPLVPMEIIVTVPKSSQRPSLRELAKVDQRSPEEQVQMPFLERMELADRVRRVILEEFGPQGRKIVGNATSAATYVRPLPDASGDSINWTYRNTTSSRLEAHRDDFLHSDYLRIDKHNGAELWRITIRIPATQGMGDGLKGVDYGQFVEELKSAVEPVVNAHRERERVLRTLVGLDDNEAATADVQPLERVANAKVLVLGMPAAAMLQAAEENAPAAAAQQSGNNPAASIQQTEIFARTLAELLRKSRVKLTLHSPELDANPHNWSKVAAEHDCVVVVSDAGYDLETIRQHAPRLVDVRDHRFDPAVDNRAAKIAGSPAAVYTGVVPIVYKAQRSLLQSLISSSLWSFLTITPLMMLVSRSFSGGLVSMLPNVLPVVMVFGGMGWLGIDVDVGSMMTASIALGVAVDDTIHYLNWFREELDRTGDRKAAILAAYKHCATPTFQAAIISGIGLSVFALSTFTPTQRFGILMLTILWMGVIAELIFFPAILAGPLGSVFKPRKKPQTAPAHREPVEPIAEPEPIGEELAIEAAQGIPAPHEIGVGTPSEHRLRLLRDDGVHGG